MISVLFSLIFIVIGCKPNTESVETQLENPSEEVLPGMAVSVTSTPFATRKVTATAAGTMPSVTQTAVEAILPIQHVKQQCSNVQQSLPQDFVSEGIILLEEFGNVSETDLSTLQSNTVTPIPILNASPFLG